MSEQTKEKIAWWVAQHLPKRVALYAFVMVHGNTGEATAYKGEYATAFKAWTRKHGLQ